MADEVNRYRHTPPATAGPHPISPRAQSGGGLERGPRTHAGKKVELITVDRETLWLQLPAAVRARILQRAGKPFHSWLWVKQDPSRPQHSWGYVLGPDGFFMAQSRLQHDGQIKHPITGFQTDPDSLRHKTVTGRPAQWSGGNPSAAQASNNSPEPSRIPGLTDMTSMVLGQLPAEAQTLLQAPFLAGEQLLSQQFDYGYEERVTKRLVVIVLAGSRTLTCVTGTGEMPAEGAEQLTHWTLTCRKTTVTQRVGV